MRRSLAGFLVLLAAAPGALAADLRGPFSLDATADGRFAVVACRRDLSVAILDLAAESASPYPFRDVPNEAGIPRVPLKVRCVGNETAILLADFAEQLTVIDVPNARVARRVAVPFYCQDALYDAKRDRFYVSNRTLDSVLVFDPAWNRVGSIDVGKRPGPMTFGPDGRLWVANRGTFDVSVVDLDAGRDVGRVFIGSRVEDLAATATAVLATNHGGAELPRLHGVPIVMDDARDIRNVVTAIDPKTLRATELFVDRGADYAGIDVRHGLVAFAGAASGTVHVAREGDASGALETVEILGPDSPLDAGVEPKGRRAYTNARDVLAIAPDRVLAVNFLRDTVTELRRVDGRFRVAGETALNETGRPLLAFASPAAHPVMTDRQRGDLHLLTLAAWQGGAQRDFSCFTCHSEWHTDFRLLFDRRDDPFAPGHPQGPERNQSLRYLARLAPYGWEGAHPDLPAFNRSAVDLHGALAAGDAPGADVADGLVAIEDVLAPGPNPYPRSWPAGEALFLGKAGCAGCHPPPLYTDRKPHDVGTGRTLDTPTLLGAWDLVRYLHDVRAGSIEEVFDPAIYERGAPSHGNIATLSDSEKRDLAAFVRSLGDAKTFREKKPVAAR